VINAASSVFGKVVKIGTRCHPLGAGNNLSQEWRFLKEYFRRDRKSISASLLNDEVWVGRSLLRIGRSTRIMDTHSFQSSHRSREANIDCFHTFLMLITTIATFDFERMEKTEQ
jgi:hypothetical protein